MEQRDILRISIENTRNIINDSITLLRDTDLQLSKHGFLPIWGNTIACETSKHINQLPNQFNNLFPQYISRSYYHQKDFQNNLETRILFLNIQFYHKDIDYFNPCVLAGVFNLKEAITKLDIIERWWLKFSAFENNIEFTLNGDEFYLQPFAEDKTEVVFWGKELITFKNNNDLKEEIIDKLLELYRK